MLYVGNSYYLHAKEGCYVCGRGDSLVDTEVPIIGEGVLAICKGCIVDMARTAGVDVDPSGRIAELERERDAARIAGEAFADQLADTEVRLERLQGEWVAAVESVQSSRAS
jgi:hypothetical protein